MGIGVGINIPPVEPQIGRLLPKEAFATGPLCQLKTGGTLWKNAPKTMLIPPTEDALAWAVEQTQKLASGQDTKQTTMYVALLLRYITLLERTADKKVILQWKPSSQETSVSSSTPASVD